MEMSSLVLTIQLLRYLILTHTQVYFRALDIQQSVRMRTGWIRSYSDSEASLRYFLGTNIHIQQLFYCDNQGIPVFWIILPKGQK